MTVTRQDASGGLGQPAGLGSAAGFSATVFCEGGGIRPGIPQARCAPEPVLSTQNAPRVRPR